MDFGLSGRSEAWLEKLQAFSDATGFRRFFRENAATYQDQIAFFRDPLKEGHRILGCSPEAPNRFRRIRRSGTLHAGLV